MSASTNQQSNEMKAGTKNSFKAWPADPNTFSTFDICELRHNFQDHPLMSIESLAGLAKRLYQTKQCRFIKPGTKETSGFVHGDSSPDGRTIDEIFQNIEAPGSWVALYDVQTDALYKSFLDEVIQSVRDLVEKEQPDIYRIAGFIFLSAPPAITPFHIDRENNFWLQIAGQKTMFVCNSDNKDLISDVQSEEFILYGAQPEPRDHFLEHARRIETGPGVGVYFPVTSPHMTRSEREWVRPGNAVSISIGVVFYTKHTRHLARIQAFNRFLRSRLGINPATPGKRPAIDWGKAIAGRIMIAIRSRFRGYKPPPSFAS